MARGSVHRWVPWSVVDQVLWSASNFALMWGAARGLPTNEFGVFAILYSGFLLFQGLFRAWYHEPQVVVFARGWNLEPPRPSTIVSPAVAVSSLLVMLSGGYALLFEGGGGAVAVAFALTLPLALIQDSLRYQFIARADMRSAALVDALWTLPFVAVAVPLALQNRFYDYRSVAVLVLLWGCTASLSWLLVARLAPGKAQWRATARLKQASRYAGRLATDDKPAEEAPAATFRLPYSMEFLTTYIGNQGLLPLLGLIGSSVVAGQYRSAQLLFAPALSLSAGLALPGVPTAARHAQLRGHRAASRYATRLALGMGLVVAAWALLLYALGPKFGLVIFGNAFEAGFHLILPMAFLGTASTMVIGLSAGVRATSFPRVPVSIRLLTLVGVVTGVVLYAARGALALTTALAIIWTASSALWACVLWTMRWKLRGEEMN
jgi:O-antigen/teichoic acid export membrane protein